VSGLTHFDAAGDARMVDVSEKDVTARTATARGVVEMAPETLAVVAEGRAKKGDVLAVARLAGIMGAKRTADLVPLCHLLPLSGVTLSLTANAEASRVEIEATVKDDRPHRRRDGGADGGDGRGADGLRHAEGGR
jgi:Molybdenum cofactor biosynthesis enzyme